jgi:hypothetical protein
LGIKTSRAYDDPGLEMIDAGDFHRIIGVVQEATRRRAGMSG